MVHPRRVEEGFGHTPLDIEMYHDHDSYHHKNEEARIDDVDHGMDNEKEQTIITQDDQTVEEGKKDEQPPPGTIIKPKSKRVATLDAFRGLTIVVMIRVDDAGEAYPRIDHSPWNGCTLADFVLPFFLFIVGVAISFALKKVPVVKDAVKKIIIRTLKLLFLGIILQGGYSHAPDDLSYGVDMKQIRWCGILQLVKAKSRPTMSSSGATVVEIVRATQRSIEEKE